LRNFLEHGGLFFYFLFEQPTLIFSKTFLPLNLRADDTALMQKTDWKKVAYFRSYGRKTIFDQSLGRHLEPKWKNFFHDFPPFLIQAKCKRIFEKNFIRTKVIADWKLEAILNFRRHFESDKKLFFYDFCGIWPLTKIKRENMKFFNIDWVMVKKPNFCGHFEQSRHFETKQNSTFLKTGGYIPFIEAVLCKFDENPRKSILVCKKCSNSISIGRRGPADHLDLCFKR
jgi:hypothetical protein